MLSVWPNNTLSNLRGQVLLYFKINIGDIDEEQRIYISSFCEWLKQSIVFDDNDKKWKYKNMDKSERGSFTFPMYGEISLPHLERWWDIDVPYLIFDFDAFERWFLDFIEKLWIEYNDSASEEKQVIDKFAADARKCLGDWDNAWFFQCIFEWWNFIENNPRKHRSSCLLFLKELWLDYWSDDEWCTTVPVEYIKF